MTFMIIIVYFWKYYIKLFLTMVGIIYLCKSTVSSQDLTGCIGMSIILPIWIRLFSDFPTSNLKTQLQLRKEYTKLCENKLYSERFYCLLKVV
ncbi:hypothetical protein D3P96_07805 [Weissella viridescens]|uniref:Uncharacterized protein n=1 Tax=Weissella viridescens TaxID=1629 RepID=A0A3P2R9G3_WEIVI|nr:hypothetical protein D3P96_07805 [Weissella viridescens]